MIGHTRKRSSVAFRDDDPSTGPESYTPLVRERPSKRRQYANTTSTPPAPLLLSRSQSHWTAIGELIVHRPYLTLPVTFPRQGFRDNPATSSLVPSPHARRARTAQSLLENTASVSHVKVDALCPRLCLSSYAAASLSRLLLPCISTVTYLDLMASPTATQSLKVCLGLNANGQHELMALPVCGHWRWRCWKGLRDCTRACQRLLTIRADMSFDILHD